MLYNYQYMIDIYEKINKFRLEGKDLVLVTVTEKEGNGPADVGKKMLVSENGEAFGTIGGGAIEHYAKTKAKEVFTKRVSCSEKYVLNDKDVALDKGEVNLKMACGGKCTLFYEFLGPKQHVYIFGAGHCGAALAKQLRNLDFFVTIIDYRKELIDSLDDSANVKVIEDFAKYIEKNPNLNNKYIVVSSPSHTYDFAILDKIFELKIKPAYFGMLCSTKKIKDYLERLYAKYGKNLDLSNFYSPIGLNLGGDSPEEVAISISSEILSHFYGKDDKKSHMREKSEEKYWK